MMKTNTIGGSTAPQVAAATTQTPTAETPTAAESAFGKSLESLLGKHAATSDVNEEELFAAAISYQLKAKYGSDFSRDFKTVFKASMIQKPDSEKVASPERAAKEALRFLVQSGRLTEADARTIRDSAFRAAQLDTNTKALYDSHGGPGDTTIATARFSQARSTVAQRLADISESTLVPPRKAAATAPTLKRKA